MYINTTQLHKNIYNFNNTNYYIWNADYTSVTKFTILFSSILSFKNYHLYSQAANIDNCTDSS